MDNKKIQSLKKLLLDSELLEELKGMTDNSVNIFDILKATDSEIRHSNTLAWLLDPNANHGLGDEFLKRFISWYANEYLDDKNDEAVNFYCVTTILSAFVGSGKVLI